MKTILVLVIASLVLLSLIAGCSPQEKTCEQLGGTPQLGVEAGCPEGTTGVKTIDVCKSCVCCVPK
jgi:hypothetical protein